MKLFIIALCITLLSACGTDSISKQEFINAHTMDPYGSGIYRRDPTFPQPPYITKSPNIGKPTDTLCTKDGVNWYPRQNGVFPLYCSIYQ